MHFISNLTIHNCPYYHIYLSNNIYNVPTLRKSVSNETNSTFDAWASSKRPITPPELHLHYTPFKNMN